MNYLKKKIKTVVHGNNKKDDDDDFDNYIPEVPPHPSTLAGNESTNLNSTNFANFDSFTKPNAEGLILPLPEPKEEIPKLSLEELKALEEKAKQEEREKLKQQVESKKDREEWQFFLSLTAKVDEVTSKTQTVLSKLQEESAVKELSKFEDPTYVDQYDETAPRTPGTWAAFDENEDRNPSDPVFIFPTEEEKQEPQKQEPVIDEETKRIAKELIEDFGFINPAPGIPLVDEVEVKPEEAVLDPFDTSFIDVEAIESGEIIVKPALIKDLDVAEIDPFDTSHIEATIKQDLVIKD